MIINTSEALGAMIKNKSFAAVSTENRADRFILLNIVCEGLQGGLIKRIGVSVRCRFSLDDRGIVAIFVYFVITVVVNKTRVVFVEVIVVV
jgi:hypothetical protein